MTVEDLEDWLKSAWRIAEQSGQTIGQYNVLVDGNEITELRIDHGTNTLEIT